MNMAVDVYRNRKRSEMARRVFDMKVKCRRLSSESLRPYSGFVYEHEQLFFECFVARVGIAAPYFTKKRFLGKQSTSFKV